MSFDDYANHIYQKHRLCVALAIIKTKPPDLDTEGYIELLKSKMVDRLDDNDVTICSDDFEMEDNESVNILKDFEDINDGYNEEVVLGEDEIQESKNAEMSNIPEELTQITYSDNSQPNIVGRVESAIVHNVTYYESDLNKNQQCSVKDFNSNKKDDNSKNCITNQELDKGVPKSDRLLGDISYDIPTVSKVDQNIDTNETIFNNSSNLSQKESHLAKDSTYDSQKTILYTVYGFTDRYTHYSQSQNQIIVPHNYLYAVNKDKNTMDNITYAETQNIAINNNNFNLQNKETVTLPIINKENEYADFKKTRNFKPLPKIMDDSTQNLNETNISESILKINEQEDTPKINFQEKQYSQDINEYFNEIHIINNENNFVNHTNLEITEAAPSEITNFPQDINKNNTFDVEITNLDYPSVNNENNVEQIEPNKSQLSSTQNHEQIIDFSQQNDDKTEMEIDFATEDTVVIPYKVLEEFNKIKTFLRRGDRRISSDGYSTDSGYRSDSQIRNSNRSALQLSGASLNQSAYCLFNHIMLCPLMAATRDITLEIAQTLAELINKLHEEENYPQFLEELLDTVDILIRQLYKGRSNEDCEFLNKDEFIQRLLLLNKSMHIQKHSIEKITDILIKFHENTKDVNQIYELTNIDEIENVSYLFHVLEILLKNYIKKKEISSQESNTISQDEDKILKKSSITDIWRKKWNPKFREISEGSRENRCVLKSCSEILNKIIVDCVHCYSLVAFSALKCFNSIQT